MKHILILDDDVSTVRLLSHFLREEDFEITGTTDAHEALTIIQDSLPDIIVSDVLMPNIDGFGVVEVVRSNVATSHIPLLFISSLSDDVHVRKAMKMGVDDYLVKPIKRELLLEAIEARINRKMHYEHQYQLALQRLRYNLTTVLPHELRTPLSAIIGITTILTSSLPMLTVTDIAELIESMHQSIVRLSKVVEATLMYSRLELLLQDAKAIAQERRRVCQNPVGLISDAAMITAEQRNRQDDIVLVNNLTEQHQNPNVAIADTYLQTLVEQLVDNACKYSPAGTPVICEIQKYGQYLLLIVVDEGRGMSKEQIQAIDAFVQFEREYYEQQGIGIGLALIKKILHLVQGSLRVDSRVGVGTIITITFPVANTAAST